MLTMLVMLVMVMVLLVVMLTMLTMVQPCSGASFTIIWPSWLFPTYQIWCQLTCNKWKCKCKYKCK